MEVVIVKDGLRSAVAFPADLLAGCAGYETAEQFIEAAADDPGIALEAAKSADDASVGQEFGDSAAEKLRSSLEANGHSVLASYSNESVGRPGNAFDDLLRAAQAGVIAQSSRIPTLRKAMTATALVTATAVLTALASAPEAEASDASRYAKDTMGAIIGGAIGSKLGKGRGKTAWTVFGAAAGVAVAEAMQKPSNPQAQGQSSFFGGGGASLPQEMRERMALQEQGVMVARDQYARALYVRQLAEDNRVVDPRNPKIVEAARMAASLLQGPEQRYMVARSDFATAYQHLAQRGYDLRDFAYTYSVLHKQVTPHDVALRDYQAMQAQAQAIQQSQVQYQQQYQNTGFSH